MENGLTFGVIALAIVIIFAVGLPRWHKNAGQDPITLPDTLSGGFLAADSPTAWADLKAAGKVTDQQIQQLVSQSGQFHGQNAVDATNALGVATAGRYYVSKDGNFMSVTAARGSGDAWFPGSGGSYSSHGDVTCFTTTSQSASSVDCRRTSADLTVEINAQGVDADTTATAVDEVYNGIG
jgi:hypothetical protein